MKFIRDIIMITNDDKIKNMHKKRLVAFLGNNRDIFAFVNAKIYTSNKEASHWLNSNLEGFLCFVLDREYKTKFIIMYSYITYEKLFEMELYCEFNKYYQIMDELFHCFEFGQGFIGFKFFNIEDAKIFSFTISKFDDKLVSKILSADHQKSKNNKEILTRNIKSVKERYIGKSIYDSKYCENGLKIIKPAYFDILNTINYDREKKHFTVEGEETKKFLKGFGLKKNDLKNTKLALDFFKQIIIGLENIDLTAKKTENDPRKLHKYLNNINYKLYPYPENSINNYDKFDVYDDYNSISNNNSKNNLCKINKSNKNIPNVPNIPNIPKIPDIALSNINQVSKKVQESNIHIESNKDESNILSSKELKEKELQNVILKKAVLSVEDSASIDNHTAMKKAIEKGVKLVKAEHKGIEKITNDDKNVLSISLAYALEQRRKDMGTDIKEDDSDSDWSD